MASPSAEAADSGDVLEEAGNQIGVTRHSVEGAFERVAVM